MIHIAQRMGRLGTEKAFEVLAKARALEAQGKHIIHLEIGEPDFDTPLNIKEAAKKALDDGFTHYGPAAGLPQARSAIARHVSATRGIQVQPEQVVVTPGAKPIMFFAILAGVDEGDEVIYPNPGFPIYESAVEFVGAKAVPLRLREEKGFTFDAEDLRQLITPRTRMLILNSPHNPTGGVLHEAGIRAIADLAKKHNLIVLSDEIYDRILYDGTTAFSIASLPGMRERTIRAAGVRDDARGAGEARRQTPGEQHIVHELIFTDRRHRGVERPPEGRGLDGGGVPPPPRHHRGRAECHIRHPVS